MDKEIIRSCNTHCLPNCYDNILIRLSGLVQLKIMSQTSILITPCGGTGTVLAFLQPGSTAIVFNYWLTVKTTSIQMESLYYWNLEHVNFEYVPVLPEDYEETTDRPGCELSTADEAYEQLVSYVA